MPWPVIAVIHERECSQDWTRSLAQGDRWDRISVRVPAGRGPFRSWEEAAVDALNGCVPDAGRNKDWTIGSLLTKLEDIMALVMPLAACRRLMCGPGPINTSRENMSATGSSIPM